MLRYKGCSKNVIQPSSREKYVNIWLEPIDTLDWLMNRRGRKFHVHKFTDLVRVHIAFKQIHYTIPKMTVNNSRECALEIMTYMKGMAINITA